MKSLHDYIIELPKPLNETFKTEQGNEFYAHQDFSVDRLSNRIATVTSTPLFVDTPIQVGYQVMFEPTILYKQIYQGVKQDYTHYVDKSQKLFRITPGMIVLYRKDENDTWKGYGQNVLVKPIEENSIPITSSVLIIPETVKETKYKKERVKLLYANESIEALGAKAGDEVIINPKGGVKFWIEGKEHWWLMNRHIWAIAS